MRGLPGPRAQQYPEGPPFESEKETQSTSTRRLAPPLHGLNHSPRFRASKTYPTQISMRHIPPTLSQSKVQPIENKNDCLGLTVRNHPLVQLVLLPLPLLSPKRDVSTRREREKEKEVRVMELIRSIDVASDEHLRDLPSWRSRDHDHGPSQSL